MATQKARYWWAIAYPENMKENWQDSISDLLQVPYAYCIHDKDLDHDGDDRKEHVHIMLAFPNTTTEKHAKSVFKELEATGRKMLANDTIRRVIAVRAAYNYLIHDTPECVKKNKHQYDRSERICGNNFDIGLYEQVSLEDKALMRKELSRLMIEKRFSDYAVFYQFVLANYDSHYESVVVTYSSHFDKLAKGIFHQEEKRKRFEFKMLNSEKGASE